MLSQLPLGVQDMIHDYVMDSPLSLCIVNDIAKKPYRIHVTYGSINYQSQAFKQLCIQKYDSHILIIDNSSMLNLIILKYYTASNCIVVDNVFNIHLSDQQMINEWERFIKECEKYTS